MLRILAGAPGNAAWLRAAARRTPPALQYSTPFHLYFIIMLVFSFCPTLFAVPTSCPASRCPAALSAPVWAHVLGRSICSRRGPCSPRLGFSPVPAIPTSPLPCAPAPLRALPPLLVSFTPYPYPPSPSPTPRVLISCRPPRFSSARPSCTPLAPGPRRFSVLLLPRPTPCPRTTTPAATGPAASDPWAYSPPPGDSPGSPPGAPFPASSSTGPPPSQAIFPRASLPCGPGCGRGGSPSSPAFPSSSPPTSRRGPAPPRPTRDRPGPPPYRRRRILPRRRQLRVPVSRRQLRARAGWLRRPLCSPCSPLLHPAPFPPLLLRLLFLLPGPFPGQ